jgi:hypothetical protein
MLPNLSHKPQKDGATAAEMVSTKSPKGLVASLGAISGFETSPPNSARLLAVDCRKLWTFLVARSNFARSIRKPRLPPHSGSYQISGSYRSHRAVNRYAESVFSADHSGHQVRDPRQVRRRSRIPIRNRKPILPLKLSV